jgi:hypothetical protein
MPRTTAQQERSLQDPAVCELLKIRDFLDNVMVRTDGCYVAGFRVQGSVTYFADDEGRNEAKGVVESLLRAMPEQSMRVQFRYEVVESLNGLLDRYRDASRSETPEVKVLDDRRLATWEEKERLGAYLSRISGVYLIWDPVTHKRAMIASGGPQSKEERRQASGTFTLSVGKAIQKTKKEHLDTLAEFESIIAGIEATMKGGGLGPIEPGCVGSKLCSNPQLRQQSACFVSAYCLRTTSSGSLSSVMNIATPSYSVWCTARQ